MFRQADGSLSSRRGYVSRRAAVTARRRLLEEVARGEVMPSRDTFESFWQHLVEHKRPYLTPGAFEDLETHGCMRPVKGAS